MLCVLELSGNLFHIMWNIQKKKVWHVGDTVSNMDLMQGWPQYIYIYALNVSVSDVV